MLLTLVITLLLVWAAVIGSIYSNFLTFFSNFSETENYNKAYYASIAALERAELVIRQREPWYVWSGWWKSSINNKWEVILTYTWIKNTPTSDWVIGVDKFSYLSSWSYKWTDIFRDIDSRTSQIPKWQWNIDWMMTSGDSNEYNMMNYENAELFLMYYDNSTWNPYNTGDTVKSNITNISWTIRLPEYLRSNFWLLDTNHSLSTTGVKDDAIVDWQVRWKYHNLNNLTDRSFTIYSFQDIVDKKPRQKDTAIRETNINDGVKLEFWNSYWNPISKNNNISREKWEITIISPYEAEIKSWAKYKEIFDNWSNLQLRLSLLNLLQTTTEWIIYPFLEYKLDFWTDISDKYFKINAEWKFDNFQVNTIIYRPTTQESILWDFTVIF